ncbi:hypothetical protein [Microscilla marina]|uniref:Uncharacterized protein n=1 Tax=Microscilla marina ATCC 23134 TaxID=313606 RepID=A1ZQS1_MICM2|nr:hypothetical protein [Microscilla marina]EAY27226.1 hypothetical protein M23134_06536 [Microscilla marina ATCC 23134]
MNIHPSPEIPIELLQRLDPSYEALLKVLAEQMTTEVLEQIALADYGMGVDECLRDLQQIVTTYQLPSKVSFALTECLELTRWTEPDTRATHLARAFSTALLLMLEKISDYTSISDENETLVALIDSIVALQMGAKSAQQLIAWRILTDYEEEKSAYMADKESQAYIDEIAANDFFIYGLLLLLVYNQADVQDIDRVTAWVIDTEKDAKNIPPFYNEYRAQHMNPQLLKAPFLLGQTNFNQRHYLWKALSKQMHSWMVNISSEVTRHTLNNLVHCIVHEQTIRF